MGSYIPPQKYPFPWKDLNTQQGSPVVLHISRFCDHNCRQTELKVLTVNFVTAESFFSFLRTVTVEYSYKSAAHTHTHISLTALCPGLPGSAGTRQLKPTWILLKQETVSRAMASAGPYASLHLAPDR